MDYYLWSLVLICCIVENIGKRTEEGQLYETDNNILCKLCPEGEYLEKPCNSDHGPSTCRSCPPDSFMDKGNNMTRCLDCRPCPIGQETKSECSTVSNTVCQCPNGTYWFGIEGPDGRCYPHSVCKDGWIVVDDGTPWKDVLCGLKYDDTDHSSTGSDETPGHNDTAIVNGKGSSLEIVLKTLVGVLAVLYLVFL